MIPILKFTLTMEQCIANNESFRLKLGLPLNHEESVSMCSRYLAFYKKYVLD